VSHFEFEGGVSGWTEEVGGGGEGRSGMRARCVLAGLVGLGVWLSPANGYCAPALVGRLGTARCPLRPRTEQPQRRRAGRRGGGCRPGMTISVPGMPGAGGGREDSGKPSSMFEDNDMYEREWVTPLWMITQEPDLNNLVMYLQEKRTVITDNPDQEHVLYFSRAQIEAAREAFSRMVRRGEMRLHRLSELTGSEIFETRYSRQVVVVGQRNGIGGQGQRFQLVQPLSAEELYAQTDLDLGSRQLERFMWQDKNTGWNKASLVANFVEYDALEVNEWGVFKCISRIKAEEEIWNKVVDEIFEIDNLVKREKELRHLSRFVKDVFGLKIVVGDEDQARRCQQKLQNLQFSDQALMSHGVPVQPSTKLLEFVEVKDYLSQPGSGGGGGGGGGGGKGVKSSGWRALKSVVQWWDTTIEIQIQVLRNYHRERERITKESHSEFKARREQIREMIATSVVCCPPCSSLVSLLA